ncbi:Clr5 domain-containing protein [Nemania abortiva]|nr:Clr5 domain-containing protein [Nemania abortiva]
MAPDWERHRAIIIHLYINDSMKLDDVVSHMREKYKFDKSKSSYEIHLKKWGAKKNVRQEEWRNIRHQINVRPGQKSQVALCGILLSENKLRKETQRYNVIPTANDFRNGLSSPGLPTDTFVRIQSPPTTELDIIWPSTLPWFQFKNRVIPTLRCASSLLRAFFNDPNQHYGRINANSLYVAWKNPLELRQAVIHLSNTVPDDTIDRQQKAEALARNKFPPCLVTEMLKVVFFRLSNNMDVNVQDSRNQREHDEFVFQLSRAVSRSNPEMLSALFSGTDATTNAIKEAVYTCAIRDRNYEFVELILKSGVDPDLPVRVTRHSRWEFKRGLMKLEWLMECHTKTGMQEAAILHDTHLGEILLNAGASVDNGTELLTLAAVEARPWRNGDDVLDFAQLLIKHGAVVRPSVSQCPRKRIHETKSLLFALTIADNNCPLAEFFAENGAIADLSPDSEVASCTCGYYGGAWSSKPFKRLQIPFNFIHLAIVSEIGI